MSRIHGSLIITPQIMPGVQHALEMYYFLWGKPDQHSLLVTLLGIATYERPVLFCGAKRVLSAAIGSIPVRHSITEIQHVEITLSFQNAQIICTYSGK